VLVLSRKGTRQTKKHALDATGEVDTKGYHLTKYFDAQPCEVASLRELYEIVEDISQRGDAFLIRGDLHSSVDLSRRIRRRIYKPGSVDANECAIVDVPCSWIMVDVDKVELPSGFDVTIEPEKSIHYAISLLPEEFQGASLIWQLSSSCGLKNRSTLSAHLFFWIDEPMANEHLRDWAKLVNEQSGQNLIDDAMFRCVQPHYVAAPVFEGINDPITGPRLGFIEGERESVALVYQPQLRKIAGYSGSSSSSIEGVGYDAKMAKLGDAPGCFGYNTVLTSATASYVASVGRDHAEEAREALKADIRERINAADQSNHSSEEISRYESDEYLDSLISSAIEKFGDQPPYWDEAELTLEEGEQKLQVVIDEFGSAARAFYESVDIDVPILAIKATAGLGKTRSVIKRLLAYNLLERGDIHYYVPSHALSKQLLDDLNEELSLYLPSEDATYERARVIYGRSHKDDAGLSLCRKADVANKVAAMGGNVYPLLCRHSSGQCQHFDDCAYLKQLEEEELPMGDMRGLLTEVKVMTHDHLFLRTKDRFVDPALVVIDEGFTKSAYTSVELPITDLLAYSDADSLIAKVAMLLIRQEPNLLGKLREITTSLALLDELEEDEQIHPSGFSNLEIESSVDAQLSALQSITRNNTPLLIRTLAYELQATDRDVSHAVVSDGVTATVLRRKELDLPVAPVLMIDADANATILETFFEQPVPVESIRVERRAEVHQFKDRTFSASKIDESDELLEQIHRFVSGVAQSGKTLVVANKKVKEWLTKLGETGATLDHFNNLRGVNAYADYQNIVLIGRTQPASTDLEKSARGIWFDADVPLRLLDQVSGSRPFVSERRGYRVKNGSGSANVQVHPDWRVQALHEQIRESESTQAIDRLRLLRDHPEGLERHVFILGSLPLDITVDHLWSWSALQESLRIIDACNGVVPLNAEHLMKAVPDVGAIRTAKKKIAELKGAASLIRLFIRDRALLTAQYRLRGQKRPSEVLYDAKFAEKDVKKQLNAMIGSEVDVF